MPHRPDLELVLPACTVRDYRPGDAPSLAKHANDKRIWLNMRDAFPHPYALADSEAFIAHAMARCVRGRAAIAVEGDVVGGIGYTLHRDVERVGVEIGYWLGVAFWGRGIMPQALSATTEFIWRAHPDLRRIWAVPYAHNAASARVLERAGYTFEGRLRQSAIKDGQVCDQLLYAIVRDEPSR